MVRGDGNGSSDDDEHGNGQNNSQNNNGSCFTELRSRERVNASLSNKITITPIIRSLSSPNLSKPRQLFPDDFKQKKK